MCNFLSVVRTRKKTYYFKPEDIESIEAKGNPLQYSYDRHASIEAHFLKGANHLAELPHIEYEYNPNHAELIEGECVGEWTSSERDGAYRKVLAQMTRLFKGKPEMVEGLIKTHKENLLLCDVLVRNPNYKATSFEYFIVGKYYKCIVATRGPTWNSDGLMDAVLDGQPRKCIRKRGRDWALFEGMPEKPCLYQGGMWHWKLDQFLKVGKPRLALKVKP